jgi:hypothetical protein
MTHLTDPATHRRVHMPARQPVAERWYSEKRLGGLARFAIAITILNILGHLFLGFEQSWATPLVALAAAYGTDLLAESFDALEHGRRPRFAGSVGTLVSFLLPAHISGLAVGMLLFAGENLWAIAFASSVAVASKWILRVQVPGPHASAPPKRHFLNPSNFGITATLLLFPSVGIAPPYQFTENISGALDWLLPLIVICTGSYLNTRATGRVPLILAWLAAFAAQAVMRGLVHDTPVLAGLAPMTGFAFILFTFYMITDPATSPSRPAAQIAFGCAVAALYALFMEVHVVFGQFYALTIVTACRGAFLAFNPVARPAAVPARATAPSS